MSRINDTLEGATRRLHDQTYNTTIDYYEPTESWGADGAKPSYPDTATEAGVDARALDPSADAERDDGGSDVDLDQVFVVRDDVRSQWTDYGESGDTAGKVIDTETGIEYIVQTVTDRRNGRVRLGCVER